MRVERLGGDQVRFFLTLDDLRDRGIQKEDLWKDLPKMNELFNEMLEHAYQELGFEVSGHVVVEVFALPAQGMVVVVTRGRTPQSDQEDLECAELYELEVTMEESDQIVFRFADLEDLIQAAIRMKPFVTQGGQVYAFRNHYFLIFDEEAVEDHLESVIAILLEYGDPSTITETYLQEYGKTIWKENAIAQIIHYFG